MYIIITYNDSIKIDFFGPSSPKECETWLKRKKIFPTKEEITTIKALINTSREEKTNN